MLLRRQEEEISQSFPSSEIRRLQEQNTSLRDAVAQMRTEMEALSGHALPSARGGGATAGTQQPDTKAAAAAPTPGEGRGGHSRAGSGSAGSAAGVPRSLVCVPPFHKLLQSMMAALPPREGLTHHFLYMG